MSKELFVGNIAWSATAEDIKALFAEAGTVVEVKLVPDREDNTKHRGFAFVTMSSEEEAQKAVKELDGRDLKGRNIRVSEKRNDR